MQTSFALIAILIAAYGGAAGADSNAATWVGLDVCVACHTVSGDHYAQTIHGRLFSLTPRNEVESRECEACHGAGSAHVSAPEEAGSILRFTRDSGRAVRTLNDACLGCHRGGERIHWSGSTHEVQELACSDCHNPMANFGGPAATREASINDTCLRCHADVGAEFRKRSHMPLHEGKIDCSDCHNPHGSATQPLLRAASANQTCTACHAEKRGPFLWEHPPVREDCGSCHRPHGSNHEALLESPRPFLCQQCHAQISQSHPNDLLTRDNLTAGSIPDLRLIGDSCTNCHVKIHGSNHPAGARFHR